MKRSGLVSGVVACRLLVLAVLALAVDLSFLHVVGEQKPASVLLAMGLVCLLGSGAGTIVARAKTRGLVFSVVLVPGLGSSFLTVLGSHERAYVGLATGTMCLLLTRER